MARPDKIIFLDIDGPMIPGTRYLENPHCSVEQDLDPRCVMVLKKIVEASGARIVTNSAHNVVHETLMEAFKQHDLYQFMHSTLKTAFPNTGKMDMDSGQRRLAAIRKWIEEFGDPSDTPLWVAFDDCFIDHKRACLVDFDAGLTMREFNWAGKYLMYSPFQGAVLR